MQKKTAILAAAALCAVAGLATWAVLRTQGNLIYRTATVQSGDINVTISATGNPNAVVTVQVGSQVRDHHGAVRRLQAAAKDASIKTAHRVELAKEGVVSSEDLDTARTTSDSAVADQHAALAQQRADEDNSSVAQADERVADTQLASNQAQLKQFAAALHSAQIDLDHTL